MEKTEDQKQHTFKMNLDEKPPESVIKEERTDFRIEKLGQKVTLISILIPILIIIILGVAYLDMKRRLITSDSTKTVEVKSLSKDIQAKFSSLSLNQTQLETSIKNLSSSKADKKGMETSFVNMEKSLSKIRKDIKKISLSVSSLNQKLNKQQARIKKNAQLLEKLQAGISTLSKDKIDEKRLVQELNNQRKIYKEMMGLISKKLEARTEDKINVVNEKIDKLENRITALIQNKTKPTGSQKSSKPSTNSTSKKQKIDDIQEQNIKN